MAFVIILNVQIYIYAFVSLYFEIIDNVCISCQTFMMVYLGSIYGSSFNDS